VKHLAAAFLLITLTLGFIATKAYTPCSVWNLSNASDVPARCVMHR
jgi:preprotein translocase subunit SecG